MRTYKNTIDLSEVITAKIMHILNNQHKIISYPLSEAIEEIIYEHAQRYIHEMFFDEE